MHCPQLKANVGLSFRHFVRLFPLPPLPFSFSCLSLPSLFATHSAFFSKTGSGLLTLFVQAHWFAGKGIKTSTPGLGCRDERDSG